MTNGTYALVDVPRAHTRRLAGDFFWGEWEREWGNAGSADPPPVYKRFAPSLEALRTNVWDKGLGVRVLQLLSGHCHLGSYLHRFHLEETAKCEWCDEDETVEHFFLLRCQRWAGLRAQTIGDLIDWSSASASLQNILSRADLLGEYVKGTRRLEF